MPVNTQPGYAKVAHRLDDQSGFRYVVFVGRERYRLGSQALLVRCHMPERKSPDAEPVR